MSVNRHNLVHWNEVTPHHVASPMYRTEDFRRGEIVLDPVVRSAVGDIAGKRLLHLQCHFGLDTLSLARMGARVTGIDFSPPAIEQARTLAREAKLEAEFVCADVLTPPDGLKDFDIVFASWGAIYWIGDIDAWMRVASEALRTGGRLFLCEGHPAMLMLDERSPPDAPLQVRWPYDSPEPHIEIGDFDYAGARQVSANRTEGYLHGLARILNAAMRAGLTIRGFSEGDRVPWKALNQLVKLDRNYWGLPAGAPLVPLNFILHAVKES